MPLYRASLNFPIIFMFFMWMMLRNVNYTLSYLCFLIIMGTCLLLLTEALYGGTQIKNCLRFVTKNGFEIHVSDEAKRDPELYLKLVASKILKALTLKQSAYIVAHSKREKELIESIPGATHRPAYLHEKLSHFVGVSIYNKETGGRQNFRLIKRFRDVKRRWNYGCTYYKVPVSEEAIEYLKGLDLSADVRPMNKKELTFVVVVLILGLVAAFTTY